MAPSCRLVASVRICLVLQCCVEHATIRTDSSCKAAPENVVGTSMLQVNHSRRSIENEAPDANAIAETQPLCISGKHVPQLFLLGAEKCATSSLAESLRGKGFHIFGAKESKFFVTWESSHTEDEVGSEAEKQTWLSVLPDCPLLTPSTRGPQRASNDVLVEASVSNLPMVPLPVGANELTPQWPSVLGAPLRYNLPRSLRRLYGNASRNVTFIIMLREPLQRMQSAWYYFRRLNFSNTQRCDNGWFPGCNELSFQDAVESSAKGARGNPPSYSMILWQSMYARLLEGYLAEFEASQFIILPFLHYVKTNPSGACEALGQALNVDMNCQDFMPFHTNGNAHVTLQESISAKACSDFDAFMQHENTRLVRLLATLQAGGGRLVNYVGPLGSEVDIRQWLEAGWSSRPTCHY